MAATTATDTTTNSSSQAPRFSRYRSVRKAAAVPIPEDVPATPDENTSQLNRTPSRYHRATRPRTHTVPVPVQSVANVAPKFTTEKSQTARDNHVEAEPSSPIQKTCSPAKQPKTTQRDGDHEFVGGPVQDQVPSDPIDSQTERQSSRVHSGTNRSPTSSPKSYEAAREEARMILEGEYDRRKELEKKQQRYEPQQDPKAPNLKRRVTQVQPAKSKPVYVDAPNLSMKMKVQRSMPEKFHDAPQSIGLKQQSVERQSNPKKSHEAVQQPPVKSQAPKTTHLCPTASLPIEITGYAPLKQADPPQFDAPISAVNAGDRRVEIRLNHAERGITLPVTPTTNSRDLLNSASIVMSEDFNPKTSILVESFSNLGLERPLRRYEHVRDVMNSWDTDAQNHLIIMTESEFQAVGLEQSDAPAEPPSKVMVQMHLSLRPGKWEKRWVILREDGQVTMSKNENDGEGTNICHLSDFDVYTPTQKQRKKLKPPKKICFAIKSQQKSAMFLDGVNFVHFFATSDKQTADRWYTAVQAWRSWYLVHMLGESVSKPKQVKPADGVLNGNDLRPSTAQSTDSMPYQLGSFKPLLDFSDLDFSGSSGNTSTDTDSKEKSSPKRASRGAGAGKTGFETSASEAINRGSRSKATPQCSYPSKLIFEAETKGLLNLNDTDQGFTGGGLLGRAMSTRRSQGAKYSGQGVNGTKGKPLVDLTPASNFANGSLLRKLEAWSTTQGEHDLKIDRTKRIEANIRVGEGL